MRALKVLVLALALSLPAWGLTSDGVSAPLTGLGAANTDCPAAIAASGATTNGGTNGKALALQLPRWANGADVEVQGTFVGTWIVYGSTDNTIYRSIPGISSANYFTGVASTAVGGLAVFGANLRYVCVWMSAYTSGTLVATIEPRASAISQYVQLGTGNASGGTNLIGGSSSSSAQGSASTSSVSAMVVMAGDKAVTHQPVAATAASASIALITGRHIGTSCTVYISTVAAQPDIVVNLRDGAAGAGTVLWTGRVTCGISSGDTCKVQSPPLNAVGSPGTAMTCETATAPAAGNFATATLTYHDAG